MRLRVSVVFLMLSMFTTVGYATSITLHTSDNLGIQGGQDGYGVSFAGAPSSTIVINNTTGAVNINLYFNYPALKLQPTDDPNLPTADPNHPFLTIKPADLLFTVNGHDYGIFISQTPFMPAGSGHDLLTEGELYSGTQFIDANTATGAPGLGVNLLRGTSAVWIGGTVLPVAALSETVTNGPIAGEIQPKFGVNITGTLSLSSQFMQDVNNNTLSAFFASADCANGYLVGAADPTPPVPEPASLVFFASGLLGIGGMVRRRVVKK